MQDLFSRIQIELRLVTEHQLHLTSFNLLVAYSLDRHDILPTQVYFQVFFVLWEKSGGKMLLKGRYTIGNCQRPVFSLGVSHHIKA